MGMVQDIVVGFWDRKLKVSWHKLNFDQLLNFIRYSYGDSKFLDFRIAKIQGLIW